MDQEVEDSRVLLDFVVDEVLKDDTMDDDFSLNQDDISPTIPVIDETDLSAQIVEKTHDENSNDQAQEEAGNDSSKKDSHENSLELEVQVGDEPNIPNEDIQPEQIEMEEAEEGSSKEKDHLDEEGDQGQKDAQEDIVIIQQDERENFEGGDEVPVEAENKDIESEKEKAMEEECEVRISKDSVDNKLEVEEKMEKGDDTKEDSNGNQDVNQKEKEQPENESVPMEDENTFHPHITNVELPNEEDGEDKGAEEEEYIVEKILDKKIDSRGHALFLVKWENYPPSSNTWEPLENLMDCDKAMQQYELMRAQKLATKYGKMKTNNGIDDAFYNGSRETNRRNEYEVNDIMGMTRIENERYFLISLANSSKSCFIRASLANRVFPGKVIDFYLKHLRWKQRVD